MLNASTDIINATAQAGILGSFAGMEGTGGLSLAIFSMAISSILPIAILIFFPNIMKRIHGYSIMSNLKKMRKLTGKHTVVLSHSSAGIFGDMITCDDLMKLEKILAKFKGEDFDLVLNTLGGDLFASMRIAKLLHNYNGNVRVFVPKYAMSGGTMICLGADEIVMDRNASLGSVDAQLGTLFKAFSTKAWNTILKKKGKKADDETMAFALLGNQAVEMTRETLNEIVKIKDPKKREAFIRQVTQGDVAHAYQYDLDYMMKTGLHVSQMTIREPHTIIENLKESCLKGV